MNRSLVTIGMTGDEVGGRKDTLHKFPSRSAHQPESECALADGHQQGGRPLLLGEGNVYPDSPSGLASLLYFPQPPKVEHQSKTASITFVILALLLFFLISPPLEVTESMATAGF